MLYHKRRVGHPLKAGLNITKSIYTTRYTLYFPFHSHKYLFSIHLIDIFITIDLITISFKLSRCCNREETYE